MKIGKSINIPLEDWLEVRRVLQRLEIPHKVAWNEKSEWARVDYWMEIPEEVREG